MQIEEAVGMGTVLPLVLAVEDVLAEDLVEEVLEEEEVLVTGHTGILALDVVIELLLPVVAGFFPKQSPLLHLPPAQ